MIIKKTNMFTAFDHDRTHNTTIFLTSTIDYDKM